MSKMNNWFIEYRDLSNTIREPIIDDSVANGGGFPSGDGYGFGVGDGGGYSSNYTESYNEDNEFDDVYGEEEVIYE